jgi:hypothetical protein
MRHKQLINSLIPFARQALIIMIVLFVVQRGLMPRTSSQTFMKVKRSTLSGMWLSYAFEK